MAALAKAAAAEGKPIEAAFFRDAAKQIAMELLPPKKMPSQK
jgi:hypothetical protein